MILRNCLVALFAAAVTTFAGCGEHLEKKNEDLVSPSQRDTEAEKEPRGAVGHGEAPSDVRTEGEGNH